MTAGAPYVAYSNLWRGEQALLFELAAAVPPGGVIVEIGTDRGGSAMLMRDASRSRQASVYSVDIAPSGQAVANLAGTSVTMITHASAEAARQWPMAQGAPIDLLFIDAGHDLINVVTDFNSWAPLVRKGGAIAFHDYDPPERGGLKHLGVQICVDAIRAGACLHNSRHTHRIFYGYRVSDEFAPITAANLCETLQSLCHHISALWSNAYSGWGIFGDQRFANLMQAALGDGATRTAILPHEKIDLGGRYLVSANPHDMPRVIAERAGLTEMRVVDGLSLCYMLNRALAVRRDRVYALADNRRALTNWCEMLHFLSIAAGGAGYPDDASEMIGADLDRLNRLVAREQIRVGILVEILADLLDWRP